MEVTTPVEHERKENGWYIHTYVHTYMTVPRCARLTIFCWNANVQNITSSMQAELLQPNGLMLSRAPQEVWGDMHTHMQGLWALPAAGEGAAQTLL